MFLLYIECMPEENSWMLGPVCKTVQNLTAQYFYVQSLIIPVRYNLRNLGINLITYVVSMLEILCMYPISMGYVEILFIFHSENKHILRTRNEYNTSRH